MQRVLQQRTDAPMSSPQQRKGWLSLRTSTHSQAHTTRTCAKHTTVRRRQTCLVEPNHTVNERSHTPQHTYDLYTMLKL